MNPPSEILTLCDRLLDGQLTAGELARLEELVLTDPAARREYVEYLHLHAALRQNASRLGDVPLAEVLRSLPTEGKIIRPRFATWWKLAAALALGALTWALLQRQAPQPPIARLAEVKAARWQNSSLPTAPGSALAPGRLHLAEGLARVVFRSGAEVSLEGPAELEIIDSNACHLHGGTLVAHVPPAARGFRVDTAHARLIDHGTDFGISTDAAGRAQVQVLQGEVELHHRASGEHLRLATRQAASITSQQLSARSQAQDEPDRNAFAREESRPAALTLTTATGAGEAAYVVSPNSPTHFSDTLLLVKNSPTPNYRRKALLRFDLTSVPIGAIAQASLSLNFEATGFGFASLLRPSTFAIYGVVTDAQDDWSAETVRWQTAPAFAPESSQVDRNHAIPLGTFSMPAGVVSGTFTLQTAELARFLDTDQNRRATLVIVRESSQASQAAVHGFAGNHHPTLAPPTLRLTLK